MSGAKTSPAKHYRHLGREMALQFIFQCELRQEATNIVPRGFWEQLKCTNDNCDERLFRRARRYATSLIAGLHKHRQEVDAKIAEFSAHWDIDRMTVIDRNIVRIATYEMLFEAEIPPVVSIDEAVSLAVSFSDERALSFINGILNAMKNSLPRHPRHRAKHLPKTAERLSSAGAEE